ncbi:HNH endonuclease [Geodermatophilus sp. SYSU D00766]
MFEAFGTLCYLCGEAGADTADHVIPWSKGGLTTLENLRPAHWRCNVSRGAKSLYAYGWPRHFRWPDDGVRDPWFLS